MTKKVFTDNDILNILDEVEAQYASALNKSEVVAEPSLAKEEFDYDSNDMAEMKNLYASMSKSEAKAHFKSLSEVIGADLSKSELVGPEVELMKSENEKLKTENEKLNKTLSNLTESLTKFVGIKKSAAPEQKSVTGENYEVIKKSEAEKENKVSVEGLSKTEIQSKLSSKIRSGEIKKSDRDAVIKYHETYDVNLIKHLL
jgi:regulator of replication initiation timing